MKHRLVLLALLSVIFNAHLSVAQTDHYGRWENGLTEGWYFDLLSYTKAEEATFKERWQAIEKEVETFQGNEWAGTYSIGDISDVHMTVLRWSPNIGFAYASINACIPNVDHLSYGKVKTSPNLIQIFPENTSTGSAKRTGHGHHARPYLPHRYLPVKWGAQHYLIPENKITMFYDYVSGLGAYQPDSHTFREGFLLKYEDRGKSAEGLPVLPPGYERFAKKPIDAEIIAVGASYVKQVSDRENPWWNEQINVVTLNVGRIDGVKRGISLYVLGSSSSEVVKVRRVNKHTSKGVVVRSVRKKPGVKVNEWDDGIDEPEPIISVGWKLSTSPHK
jgi:hypothetical protein